MFGWFTRRGSADRGLPTVRFDTSRITDAVRADLRANVQSIEDIDRPHVEPIYRAALAAIGKGGDLHAFTNDIEALRIPGVSRNRAADMAMWLCHAASALMADERQAASGIKRAKWLHSGAPCVPYRGEPLAAHRRQDTAHRSSSGRTYRTGKGLFVDGRWTVPGREYGCKCISIPIIEGFD